MTRLRSHALETVWALLVVATCASYRTGVDHTGDVAAALVICVAFVKVRMIGAHFMELASAPRGLALAFDAYVGGVATGLLVLYLAV